MKHGPVLSATYDLIKARGNGYWHRHLRTTGYCVERVADAGSDNLSPAEQRIITGAFDRYGHLDTWALRDFTHELEEWQDPGQTSRQITYGDVLRIEGLPDDEIASVLDNITGHPGNGQTLTVFRAGDTFLITDPDGGKQHLRIVLTAQSGSPPTVLTVQLNSATLLSDTTTVIEAGEHPFCIRRSVVSYDTMCVMEVGLLIEIEARTKLMPEPLFLRHQRCSPNLLERILQGALASEMVAPIMRRELVKRLTVASGDP